VDNKPSLARDDDDIDEEEEEEEREIIDSCSAISCRDFSPSTTLMYDRP
jgi:hypothetical protein